MNYLLSVVFYIIGPQTPSGLVSSNHSSKRPIQCLTDGLICVCEHCMEIVNCRGTNYFSFQLVNSAGVRYYVSKMETQESEGCTLYREHLSIQPPGNPQSGSGTRRRIPDFEERELHSPDEMKKRFASLDRMKYRESGG